MTLHRGQIFRQVAILLALGCAPSVTQGQTFSCAQENSVDASGLKNFLISLATAPANSQLDSVRVRYQLPSGSAATVVFQKNKSLCTQAAQAYHNVVLPGDRQKSRDMVVFKVGSNRYVALDPSERFGEHLFNVVFTLAFIKLHSFTG